MADDKNDDPENTENGPLNDPNISSISIEDEMRRSYLDYAMSVIVSRAIPDARDGLKPVHRRILWSMHENKYFWDRPYKKSARVVGDVIGKYHPHGDQAVYDALVRMAQDFSMRLPLLDGQGNFGSIDGDPPAAMRYTEVRMGKPAHSLLEISKKILLRFRRTMTVRNMSRPFCRRVSPTFWSMAPGALLSGWRRISRRTIWARSSTQPVAMIDNPEVSDEELISIVPGPDFPTGGIILGRAGSKAALLLGRGSVVMRGQATIEEIRKDRYAIIVTEIPFQVNKSLMIERIAGSGA